MRMSNAYVETCIWREKKKEGKNMLIHFIYI